MSHATRLDTGSILLDMYNRRQFFNRPAYLRMHQPQFSLYLVLDKVMPWFSLDLSNTLVGLTSVVLSFMQHVVVGFSF